MHVKVTRENGNTYTLVVMSSTEAVIEVRDRAGHTIREYRGARAQTLAMAQWMRLTGLVKEARC